MSITYPTRIVGDALTNAADGRITTEETPHYRALLEAAATDRPTTHPADVAADLGDILREAGDCRADTSGTAEDIIDRVADAHPSRGALINFTAYLQDEAGGDTWSIGQNLLDAANHLDGIARDLAGDPTLTALENTPW